MSGSVNKVILVGRLGDKPEIRRTQDGKAIANFSVATSETWKDKNTGERKEKTEWSRVVCFNDGLNKVIEQYLDKGSQIYLEGSLQTRKWQDQNGNDRYTTEIVLQPYTGVLTMLGGNSESRRSQSNSGDYAKASRGEPQPQGNLPTGGDFEDDIPFEKA